MLNVLGKGGSMKEEAFLSLQKALRVSTDLPKLHLWEREARQRPCSNWRVRWLPLSSRPAHIWLKSNCLLADQHIVVTSDTDIKSMADELPPGRDGGYRRDEGRWTDAGLEMKNC